MGKNSEAINQFIRGLKYDPEKLLAFNGTKVDNFVSKESEVEDDNFIVITRRKETIEGNYDISIPNAYRDKTYPGAMIFADQKLIDNMPNLISTKRKPIKLTVDLPHMGDSNQEIIQEPDYANVSAGIDRMLDKWFQKNTAIPAIFTYQKGIVYDQNSMSLKFGCNGKWMGQKLGINFSDIHNQEKSVYLIKFKQIFYSVSVDPYHEPAKAFDDSVTVQDLQRLGIDDINVPAYVQNVQYGREIYLMFESNMHSDELSAYIDANILIPETGGLTVGANADSAYKKTGKNISCTFIVMGGSSEAFKGDFSDDKIYEHVDKLIKDNMTLSANNPAFPLNYATVFLKDSKSANINGTSEYVKTTYKTYKSGTLKLNHKGAYVAKFNVSWDEYNYDSDGHKKITAHQWENNGKNFTAPYKTEIPLKGNTTNICVKCQGATGLIWEQWRTNLDKKDIPLSHLIKVTVSGTTLNQKSQIEHINE